MQLTKSIDIQKAKECYLDFTDEVDFYEIRDNDTLVGFVNCDLEESCIYLCAIEILPEYRRRGYAKKTIKRIFQIYNKNLMCGECINLRACNLIRNLGGEIKPFDETRTAKFTLRKIIQENSLI